MKYYEFTFQLSPSSTDAQDVLAAVLAEVGFDSFVPTESGCNPLLAYIQQEVYSAAELEACLYSFPLPEVGVVYDYKEVEDKNWNEEWEKHYFQPIVVDNRCVVASTFHQEVPEAEYKILINPRMSFGTGHHATTAQMLSEILELDLAGKRVLDMGCGTSILAILARLRGAATVVAIDYDEWCVDNSKENIEINGLDGIEVVLGDASALRGLTPFDVILANINRNILLADMESYVAVMKQGAEIIMSGFFVDDIPLLEEAARRHGLRLLRRREQERWGCMALVRE